MPRSLRRICLNPHKFLNKMIKPSDGQINNALTQWYLYNNSAASISNLRGALSSDERMNYAPEDKVSGMIVLGERQYEHFEKCMTNPEAPTKMMMEAQQLILQKAYVARW